MIMCTSERSKFKSSQIIMRYNGRCSQIMKRKRKIFRRLFVPVKKLKRAQSIKVLEPD